VNYTPAPSTAKLMQPTSYDLQNSYAVKKLNLSTCRVVSTSGRDSKTIRLSGIEYNTAASTASMRLAAVKAMKETASKVVLTNLVDANLDGSFIIRSFTFEKDDTHPTVYQWTLDLEATS